MEKWRIIVVVGVAVFLVAAALPLLFVQIEFLGAEIAYSLSLLDIYRMIVQGDLSTGGTGGPNGTGGNGFQNIMLGLIVTIVLFPVPGIVGLISAGTNRKRLALVAGILGVVCWLGAVWAILGLQSLLGEAAQYGLGIFIGIIGAVILVGSYLAARANV